MAKITLSLDKRCAQYGQYPVRIRINHKNTSAYINTGVRCEERYFDANSLRAPILSGDVSAKIKNEQIALLVRKYDEVIFDIQRDCDIDSMSANDIRKYIVGEREHVRTHVQAHKRGDRGDFSVWFDNYATTKGERVQSDMMYVSRLMAEYCTSRGIDRIWFDELKYDMLVDMEHWLHATGRGDATRVKMFSYIRSAWNEAERRELVEYGKTPFRNYRIRLALVSDEIETISVDGLRRLIALELTEGSRICRARDMLVLCFMMCGPDLIDLYNMPSVKDGDAVYVRHKLQNKTARAVHIHMEPEAQIIADMYRGTERMLYLQERYPNYKTYQRRHCLDCDRLSALVGEKVNMERMRRTWATIAAELDVPDRVIDKSMGHVDSSVKDKHYEQYDWSRTARYNRKVIDYVLYGVTNDSPSRM